MSKWKCNGCGQVYDDLPGTLPHVCYPEVIEHSEHAQDGTITKPEKRTLRDNVRNEHMKPGVILLQEPDLAPRYVRFDTVAQKYVDAKREIISDGLGRTLVSE